MTIYGRGMNELRVCVKYAFMLAGLEYLQDFRVTVRPFRATIKDYCTLCAYILKYNGKRETNRFIPVLFKKGLGIRKIGAFGGWFAKPKKVLWEEYKAEIRQKHPDRTFQRSRTGEVLGPNKINRKLAKTQSVRDAAAADAIRKTSCLPPREREVADIINTILKWEPGKNIVVYEDFLREWELLGGICGQLSGFMRWHGFEVRTIDGIEQIVMAPREPHKELPF
jgi:hypothetical protein